MKSQNEASAKPVEFETTATYQMGKTTIVVDSVFRQEGRDINQILSRLILADVEAT